MKLVKISDKEEKYVNPRFVESVSRSYSVLIVPGGRPDTTEWTTVTTTNGILTTDLLVEEVLKRLSQGDKGE